MKIQYKKVNENAISPIYSHDGDAGLDLCSCEERIIKASSTETISTGITLAIPSGYVGLIWDRSGLAAKKHVHRLAGVVDSNYRGEIKVVLTNLGKNDLEIKVRDRIAQMLIQKIEKVELEEVEELQESNRGEKGFGSTGR